MVGELAALVTAVGATRELLREGNGLIQQIRSGWGAKNEEAKAQLSKNLEELQANLARVGELARFLEAYARVLEDLQELIGVCRRTHRFVRDNLEAIADPKSPGRDANWRLLESLFETIDDNREQPRRAAMDRAQYQDERDRIQVNGKLQDFSNAYERASQAVRNKLARELDHELAAMIRPLVDAEDALKSTFYDGILGELQKLGT